MCVCVCILMISNMWLCDTVPTSNSQSCNSLEWVNNDLVTYSETHSEFEYVDRNVYICRDVSICVCVCILVLSHVWMHHKMGDYTSCHACVKEYSTNNWHILRLIQIRVRWQGGAYLSWCIYLCVEIWCRMRVNVWFRIMTHQWTSHKQTYATYLKTHEKFEYVDQKGRTYREISTLWQRGMYSSWHIWILTWR